MAAALAFGLGLVATGGASANTSTDITNHITYSAPNTYTYTTTLLDFIRVGGSPDPIVVTHTGGTVNANRVSLSNGIVYTKSGGSANFSDYMVIACYSAGAITSSLDHQGGDLTTPSIRLACFNGNRGTLTMSGGQLTSNLIVLSGPNSSQATVNLNGGTLTSSSIVRDGNDAFQSTARLLFNGGTLRAGSTDNANWLNLTNGYSYLNNVTVTAINGGGAVFDTNGRSMGIAIPLSGSGSLTKRGSGTLSFSANQNYAGSTQVEAGTLQLTSANSLPSGSVFLNGGTLGFQAITAATLGGLGGHSNLALQNTEGSPVTLSVGGNGANTTYTGGFTGSGTLLKQGSGSLTLGGFSSHTGGTTVNAGTLNLAAFNNGAGTLGGALTINPGATVVTSAVDALGWLAGATVTSITVNGGTLDNTAAGNNGWGVAYTLNAATLRTNGGVGSTSAASKLSFGGPAGATTSVSVSGATPSTLAGHVNLRGDNGNTRVDISVASGARLDVPAGISSNSNIGLRKLGAGTLALAFADNTYSGATELTAGTLLVNGSTGSGAVSVAAGATLGGAGEVRGATSIASGGRLAPGNPVGTLRFTNGLSLANGSVLELGLGSSSDMLRVSGGTFTGSGAGGVTVHLANTGGFSVPGSYTLIDFTGATPSGVDAGDFVLGTVLPGPYDYAIVLEGSAVKLQVEESDLTGPAVTAVDAPVAGTRRAGQLLDVVVRFNEATLVTGTPQLPISLASGNVAAAYHSGSGSTALTFRYSVVSGDNDADGIGIAGPLLNNGGSLRDAAGNAASLALQGIADMSQVRVDALAPAVQSIQLDGAPGAGSTTVRFAIRFTEAVSGVDIADFALAFPTGGAFGRIDAFSGSGRDYLVDVADIRGRGTLRLDLDAQGTGILDLAGNPIATGFTAGHAFAADVERAVCHVDSAAQGDNTGTSWANAYTDLHDALPGDTRCRAVWIAGGIYRAGANGFVLAQPISLHGGFAGTETSLGERGAEVIAANPTVLSGDADGDDASDAQGILASADGIAGSNRSVVVDLTSAPYSASNTVLDGLTITAADGHGLRCRASASGQSCNYRLTNSVFSGNRGAVGAALLNLADDGGDASPTLDRVLFRGNRATAEGSAVVNQSDGAGATANPVFDRVVFTGNLGQSVIVNAANLGEARLDLSHSMLVHNTLGVAAAVIRNDTSAAGSGVVTLHNSVIWGNAGTPLAHTGPGSTASFTHSIVQDSGGSGAGWAGAGSDLGGNRDADPLLGALGWFGAAIPGFLPRAGSAVIDAGAACSGDDHRGVTRPQGAACDIGATEVRQYPLTISVSGSGFVSTATPSVGDTFGACSQGGSPCNGLFAEGTRLSFTRHAAAHAHFIGWSGDCAADGTVDMDAARQCSASFANNLLNVTLARSAGTTPSPFGSPLRFTATLTPSAPATAVPTGTVDFLAGSSVVGSAELVNGVATWQADTALDVGSYTLSARYRGDERYLPAAQPGSNSLPQEVNQASGSLRFDALAFTYNGTAHGLGAQVVEDAAVTCTVTPSSIGPDAGDYPVSASCSGLNYTASASATATINKADGSVEFTTSRSTWDGSPRTVTARIAEEPSSACSVTPASIGPGAGEHPVGATCEGDNYRASGSGSITIDRAVQAIAFAALPSRTLPQSGFSVSASGGGSGNAVSFRSETRAVCETSGSNGSTITLLTTGTCTLRASQEGDANHLPAAAVERSFAVTAGGVAVSLQSDRPLANAGESITFSANVSGLAPTGSLRFIADGSDISGCTSVALGGSGDTRTAVCTTAGLAAGSRQIEAVYAGDGNNASGSSPPLTQTINALPSISTLPAQSLLEDGVLGPLTISIDDAETAPAALTLGVSIDDASLVAPGGLQVAGSGATRTLHISPQADAFGTATVTLEVSDAQGVTARSSFVLTVLPVNDAPTLTLGAERLLPGAGSGTHTLPGFATSTPGPANESGQTISYTLDTLSDARNVLSSAVVTSDGTLSYAVTGVEGEALLRLTASDDGGRANGGLDRRSREFRIVVGGGAAMSLRVYRSAPTASRLASVVAGDANLVEYVVEASNHGPASVDGANLVVTVPSALHEVLWSCSAPAPCSPVNGSVAASGNRIITAALTLAAGETARLALNGTLDAQAMWLELVAQASLPAGVGLIGHTPRATLTEPVAPEAVHRNGFE